MIKTYLTVSILSLYRTDEFSVIVGVREDILEILLNLKGVILKSKTLDSQVGRIKVQGPAIITADLIQLPEDLKIINPNHYIATISSNNTVEIELKELVPALPP